MIKIVHKNLLGVYNMADQGRIILQNYCMWTISQLIIKERVREVENSDFGHIHVQMEFNTAADSDMNEHSL